MTCAFSVIESAFSQAYAVGPVWLRHVFGLSMIKAGKYWRLVRYPRRQWRSLLGIGMLTVASSVVTALEPWPLKLLVDHMLGDAGLPPALLAFLDGVGEQATPAAWIAALALAALALALLSAALDVGLSCGWAVMGQRMVYAVAVDLFHRLQRLSLRFHSRQTIGDSLNRLATDTWCVQTVTDALLVAPVQHGLTLFAVGSVAWALDPWLTVLALTFVPLLVVGAFVFGGRLRDRTRQHREAQSRLLAFVQQILAAIPIVQAFGSERRNLDRFHILSADCVTLSQRSLFVYHGFSLSNGIAMTLGSALVLLIGGQRVLSGALSVGSLLVFLAYVKSVQSATQGLLKAFAEFKAAEPSIDRVLEVLEVEEGVNEAPNAKPLPALSFGKRHGHVCFDGVSFGYEPDRPVLQDICLEARPGETVALVGPTGAGKSTLVSLIPRFFDPWQGRVFLDGFDIRNVRLASLRAQIAVVFQEPFLFPVSVAENIAYGRPSATRTEIKAAATAANADDFIHRLPQGYDTILGERGFTLSGGEKQRIAIARAFVKDAPVLILDEPTSALDLQTEAQLLQALERLMEERTTFIIAHRLSTIRKANRIAVIENGRVSETGNHGDLLAAGKRYARLYAQFMFEAPGEMQAGEVQA